LAHLTEAIELGGPLTALVALVAERQAERDQLRDELARAETFQHIAIDRAAIEAEVQAEVANWRGLLTGSVEDGRQLLREALEQPFVFQRDGDAYKFTACVATGRLISGVIGRCGPHLGASLMVAISNHIDETIAAIRAIKLTGVEAVVDRLDTLTSGEFTEIRRGIGIRNQRLEVGDQRAEITEIGDLLLRNVPSVNIQSRR
jgi:hypothetical protein